MKWNTVAALLLLATAAPVAAQDLDSVLRSYTGSPEQNAFLWRNLEALRGRSNVPPQVVEGLNTYRVASVRAAREAVVRDMMSSGQHSDKALAGFINTGTWNDPKRFMVKSDVDFTAVGRDPKAVKEFQKRFYEKLGNQVGVPPGRVIKTLDVNCYSLGGTEPGAFRTPGGRRFFEVYSAKTGGYEAITGSGANATVTRSHIDNAFIDLGKKVPRFTPADSAMFAGELRSQIRSNATAFRGAATAEAKANAKLVERVAYANAVAEGKVLGQTAATRVVQEAAALRAGQSMEQALAGRVDQLMKTGLSRQQAVQAATKQFVNETRNYVEHSTARLANNAAKAEQAQLASTENMLQKLSGGKLAAGALKAGMGALTLYFLHDAYQREGGKGLAKEIVKQGLFHSFPPAVLADLAGIGVKFGGQALIDYANQCKSDGVLNTMTGGTPQGMLDFYKKYHNPEEFRKYLDREWEEQYKHSGAYWGKGVSDEQMKELIFDQGRAMMLQITTLLREEKQKEQRVLRELQQQIREDQARDEAENEDRELTAELRELQQQEMKEFRDQEVARVGDIDGKEKIAEEAETEKESLWSRLTRKDRKSETEKSAEEEAKGEDEGSDRDKEEKQEEEPAAAGVAPNLVRTSWSGQIAIQEAGGDMVGGSVALPIQFSIDNYNRISGSCRFPAVTGQGSTDDGIRDIKFEGRYDSRSGRIEIPMEFTHRSAPLTDMAGVPIIEEARLRAKITALAEASDMLMGDIQASITVTKMAGRAYGEDELQAWAAQWWRGAWGSKQATAEEMARTVQSARDALQTEELYSEPLSATWRAGKVK